MISLWTLRLHTARWLHLRPDYIGQSSTSSIGALGNHSGMTSCRRFWRAIWALALITAFVISPSPSWSVTFSDRYDSDIKAAVERWWPDFPDWRYWKAQLYQESRLDPAAVSPVGARGLCQAMPKTWSDLQRQLGWRDVSPHSAKHCIFAGAYMMRQLRKQWKSQRPALDRQFLAAASYNAGLRNILDAQSLCGGKILYSDIIPCLIRVTGLRNSTETVTYVERIKLWRNQMER